MVNTGQFETLDGKTVTTFDIARMFHDKKDLARALSPEQQFLLCLNTIKLLVENDDFDVTKFSNILIFANIFAELLGNDKIQANIFAHQLFAELNSSNKENKNA